MSLARPSGASTPRPGACAAWRLRLAGPKRKPNGRPSPIASALVPSPARSVARATLTPQEQDRARAARAGIVDRLHQQIDAAVAEAYGWPADLSPAEVVARLVALNAARAAEERQGKIRWLRPDYQISRFGAKQG